MIYYNTVLSVLNKLGYKTVSPDVYADMALWDSWYRGDVSKFHQYTVDTGTQKLRISRYSLGMAKQVCEDWADLLLNEKVAITATGTGEDALIHDVLDSNNFQIRGNEMQEEKARLGTVAYVPHIVGAELVDGQPTGNAAGIVIDYIPGDQIYPLSWINGRITEAAFAQETTEGNQRYLYLQLHVKGSDGLYDIQNRLYNTSGGVPVEVPLDTLTQYAALEPVIHTLSSHPQFVIDRLNILNNSKAGGPLGISVFANAIDQLKASDIAYDSYVNEYILGKKRIIVKVQALKDLDGKPIFDTSDLVYYALPEDGEQDTMVKEIDMTIRAEQHSRGIQDMLNCLSQKCGLGNSFYRFESGTVAKTATEVISSNSKLFRTLKKHELILGDALRELCRIIIHLGNTYLGQNLNEDVEINISFDDSIIEDTETEFRRDQAMLAAGVINRWEFRAKWMHEDEQTAQAALPQLDALTEESE